VGLVRSQESDRALAQLLSVCFGTPVTCDFHEQFYHRNEKQIKSVMAVRARTSFGGIDESDAQKDHSFGGALESDKQKDCQYGGKGMSEKQKTARVDHGSGGKHMSDKQEAGRYGGKHESEKQKTARAKTQYGGKHISEKQKGRRWGGKVMSEKQKKQRDYSSEPSERTRRLVDSAPVARKLKGCNTLAGLRTTAIKLGVLLERHPDNAIIKERLMTIQAEIEAAEK
jgi:hypothetical protein